jgi:hypothetical protein
VRLWIVECWTSEGWVPERAWARTRRLDACAIVDRLVKNAGYKRRELRVKSWVREEGR